MEFRGTYLAGKTIKKSKKVIKIRFTCERKRVMIR